MSLIERHPSTEISASPRLVIPFLDTEPLTDVKLAILLLPVWWWLGIEQFIWPVVFGVATLKVLYLQRLRLRVTRPLPWFALFLVAVLISGLFVQEQARYMTYARNFGAFVAGFFAFLIITNRARSMKAIEGLLNAVLVVVLLAGVAGLLAVLDIWRPAIHSLMGSVLPTSVMATSYGHALAIRELGQVGWFTGLGSYFRLSSFFLFGNHYSGVLIYVIPFLFMRMSQSRNVVKIAVALGIVLLIINLIYTTGRVAALSLLVGALYFALFQAIYRRTVRALAGVGLTIAILLVLFLSVVEFGSASQDAGLIEQTTSTIEAFVLARGSGSYTSRFGVYTATLEGFLERPLFGWGTERDVEGLDLPAGSHSEYLAALYRQGILGIFALTGLLLSTWRATGPPRGSEAAKGRDGSILRYGRWFFIAAILNSVMNDPSVDSTSFVILWVLMALLVTTHRYSSAQGDNGAPAG